MYLRIQIPPNLFAGLARLGNLFFADAPITGIAKTLFAGAKSLGRVSMHGARISVLPKDLWKDARYWTYLGGMDGYHPVLGRLLSDVNPKTGQADDINGIDFGWTLRCNGMPGYREDANHRPTPGDVTLKKEYCHCNRFHETYRPPSSNSTKLVHSGSNNKPGTLRECEGHCNKDAECKIGLKCFVRTSNDQKIPGCPTNWGVHSKANYCYQARLKVYDSDGYIYCSQDGDPPPFSCNGGHISSTGCASLPSPCPNGAGTCDWGVNADYLEYIDVDIPSVHKKGSFPHTCDGKIFLFFLAHAISSYCLFCDVLSLPQCVLVHADTHTVQFFTCCSN